MKPAFVLILLILFIFLGVLVFKYIFSLFPGMGGMPRGNDGGIFKSTDSGDNWIQLAVRREKGKEKISGFNIYDIEIHPQDSRIIFAGAQGAGLLKSIDGGESWQKLSRKSLGADCDVYSVAVDAKNPQNIYLASYYAGRGRILKSVDEGKSFKEVFVTYADGVLVFQAEVDSYDPAVIFASISDGSFLQSRDSGISWQVLKNFETSIKKFVINPQNTREIYLFLKDRGLFKTLDKGLSWQDLGPNLEKLYTRYEIGQIQEIAIDPVSPNLVYFGMGSKFLRSPDGGGSFEEIKSLAVGEKYQISTISIDPSNPSTIYIGGGSQIYKSKDGGDHWVVRKLETNRKINVSKINLSDSSVIYVGVGK